MSAREAAPVWQVTGRNARLATAGSSHRRGGPLPNAAPGATHVLLSLQAGSASVAGPGSCVLERTLPSRAGPSGEQKTGSSGTRPASVGGGTGMVRMGCEGSSRPEMRLISEAGTESDLRGTDLFGAEENMLAYWVSLQNNSWVFLWSGAGHMATLYMNFDLGKGSPARA